VTSPTAVDARREAAREKDTGRFGQQHHSAPELTLGGAPEPVVAELTVEWTERDVIPPRARKPRDVMRTLDVQVTIPATTADDAPVGFVVTEEKYDRDGWVTETQELRAYDGKLYRPLTQNVDGVVGPMPADASTVIRRAFDRGWRDNPHIEGDTPEQVAANAQKEVDGYLAIDGTLWVEQSEPVYYVETYGFGGNRGSTALRIGTAAQFRSGDHTAPEHVFPADQREEAIAHAIKVAGGRGDTESFNRIRNSCRIEVTGEFQPGSTFRPAPRLDYVEPWEAERAERYDGQAGAVQEALFGLRRQLLNIPGAVEDVPDGWGGTTKRVNLKVLSEGQARDYKKFLELEAGID